MNDDPAVPARAAYERWAATYDAQANATRDLDAAVLRGMGLPLDGRDVIEIGAGTGKNTAYLAARARGVLALDLSPGMLARARERVPDRARVRFVEHDVTRVPWPAADGAADAVVGNLVLEHVADLGPVFAEARRVLRPGGLLFVCELHPYRQWQGSRARFVSADGVVRVEAYAHTAAEYVNAALGRGFVLLRLDEWPDPGEAGPDGTAMALPRLLSALFRRG